MNPVNQGNSQRRVQTLDPKHAGNGRAFQASNRPVREVVSFGAYRLLPLERQLMKNDEAVKLGSRAFDILLALVDRAGEVVSQKELIAKVWPNLFVEDVSLRFHITALRKVLDCDGTRYLVNVPGRGYCLVAPVSRTQTENALEFDRAIEPAYALPPKLTRMVGRDEDVRAICEALLSRKFVSVIGPGGVGKTTAALSAAHVLLPEFSGAVCFVELSPIGSPEVLGATVTSAFRLPVHAQDPIPELVAHLRGRRILLVLDGCEHLIGPAAAMAERLFSETSHLHILATSREALRTESEYVHMLPPLVSPPEGEALTAAEALAYPATQLFLERVASAGHANALSNEDAEIVGQMCRQLGGIALAIELAAGRVAAYGIRETASLLTSQFALRWPGRRTAPARQQTLNATLDWSYGLLSGAECAALRRLSVFAGSFTLEAAQQVAGEGSSADDVVTAVGGLSDKFLIAADLAGPVARYRLLDTTRAYARAKLKESGERESTSRRHAVCCRDLLMQAALDGRDPRTLAPEIDNIRAALQWSFGVAGDGDLGVALAALSATTWLGLGRLSECHDWMRTASDAINPARTPPQFQLGIYMALASTLLFTASSIDEFEPAWNKALSLARTVGDIDSQMSCHLALWARQVRVPRYAASLGVAEECLNTAMPSQSPGAIGQAEWMLGESKLFLGRLEEAMRHFRRFLEIDTEPSRLAMMRQTGYDRRSDGLGYGSCILWLTGFPEHALRTARDAVAAAASLEFPLPVAVAGMWSGFNRYFLEPDIDLLEADMVELVEHARTHGIPQFHGFGLTILGLSQARRGQFDDEAVRLVQEGLLLQAASHNKVFHPIFRTELAEAAVGLGRFADAERILADNDADDVNDPEHWCTPEILRVKGAIAEAIGIQDGAAELYRRAAALARRHGTLAWELRAAASLSRLRASQDRPVEALACLQSVYNRFSEGRNVPDLIRAKQQIDDLKARV
jgi:predicted ATPase/DNA-binding winged helix-turn-helix (wHTH) protein